MAGLTKTELKETVRRVILAQGNDFIKELLRQHGLKIGTTKSDFAANIAEAIDADALTQEMIESWLREIEGWGNQHLYVFSAPTSDPDELPSKIAASVHGEFLGADQIYSFPDELALTSITLDANHLSIIWHQGKEGWNRAREKDFSDVEGLEVYRYEAFRRRVDRSLVRFEWRFADPYAAILIHRNAEIDHAAATADVWAVLKAIGIGPAPLPKVLLNQAVKQASRSEKSAQSTRFDVEDGYVLISAKLADGGIDAVPAIRQVRLAVNDSEFGKAEGMFHLEVAEHEVRRPLSVQVIGSEGRVRLWAQCKRDDVYLIIEWLWGHNQE